MVLSLLYFFRNIDEQFLKNCKCILCQVKILHTMSCQKLVSVVLSSRQHHLGLECIMKKLHKCTIPNTSRLFESIASVYSSTKLRIGCYYCSSCRYVIILHFIFWQVRFLHVSIVSEREHISDLQLSACDSNFGYVQQRNTYGFWSYYPAL